MPGQKFMKAKENLIHVFQQGKPRGIAFRPDENPHQGISVCNQMGALANRSGRCREITNRHKSWPLKPSETILLLSY
jgi:hypothetical protein